LVLAAAFVAGPAFACEVPVSASIAVGSVAPAAVKAGAVPYTATGAGFSCATLNILTLLSGNFLAARIPTGSILGLTSIRNRQTPLLISHSPTQAVRMNSSPASPLIT